MEWSEIWSETWRGFWSGIRSKIWSDLLYPPQTMFVGGYTVFTLSERPTERTSERVSVTFCFLNILKNH